MKKIAIKSIRGSLLLLNLLIMLSCLYRCTLYQKIVNKSLLQQHMAVDHLAELRSILQRQQQEAQDPLLVEYNLEKIAREQLAMSYPDEIIYIIKRS